MERRYLAATLALAATFAIVSRGFDSGKLAKLPRSRAEVVADLTCAKRYVAQQLMAKLEPYVDRGAPEQAQMLAELNLPDLARVEQKVSDAQTVVVQQMAQQKCDAALRAQQKAKQQIFRMQIRSADQAQRWNDLTVVRAQDLSDRAQQWSTVASDRAFQVNVKAIERAQEVAARQMERAQCAFEKSREKMARAQAHSQGMPIHINFVAPAPMNFSFQVPATPEPPANTIF
jgi:hypothetical protein